MCKQVSVQLRSVKAARPARDVLRHPEVHRAQQDYHNHRNNGVLLPEHPVQEQVAQQRSNLQHDVHTDRDLTHGAAGGVRHGVSGRGDGRVLLGKRAVDVAMERRWGGDGVIVKDREGTGRNEKEGEGKGKEGEGVRKE